MNLETAPIDIEFKLSLHFAQRLEADVTERADEIRKQRDLECHGSDPRSDYKTRSRTASKSIQKLVHERPCKRIASGASRGGSRTARGDLAVAMACSAFLAIKPYVTNYPTRTRYRTRRRGPKQPIRKLGCNDDSRQPQP